MAEDDQLSFAPVLEVDLGAVFGRDPGAILGRVRADRLAPFSSAVVVSPSRSLPDPTKGALQERCG